MNLVIMGSGKGTNFEAVHGAICSRALTAQIALVISDKADAPLLAKAQASGLSTAHIPADSPGKLLAVLEQMAPDYIILAGYMRILPREVVEHYPRRIINIHPSLLPKYPGLNAPKQAIDAGEKETGCTVHYVDAGVDTGSIIAQARVPILAGDTPESLHARIQEAEHSLLPSILAQFAPAQ